MRARLRGTRIGKTRLGAQQPAVKKAAQTRGRGHYKKRSKTREKKRYKRVTPGLGPSPTQKSRTAAAAVQMKMRSASCCENRSLQLAVHAAAKRVPGERTGRVARCSVSADEEREDKAPSPPRCTLEQLTFFFLRADYKFRKNGKNRRANKE